MVTSLCAGGAGGVVRRGCLRSELVMGFLKCGEFFLMK